jgi:hypothetical protein
MTESENNLACGMHHLERQAMGGDKCAGAVLAEVKRLRAIEDARRGRMQGSTHWDGCERVHIDCAVTRIDVLEEDVKRLRSNYANLEECYKDRDSDLQHEYDRANAAEKELERLRGELAASQERERGLTEALERLMQWAITTYMGNASEAGPLSDVMDVVLRALATGKKE